MFILTVVLTVDTFKLFQFRSEKGRFNILKIIFTHTFTCVCNGNNFIFFGLLSVFFGEIKYR